MLMACGNDTGTSETDKTDLTNQKNAITAKAIENLEYTDYALSSKSENAIVNWQGYQELAIQIGYLKKADLSFFNEEKKLLKTTIDEFTGNVPKDLRTNPILSRIVVVETSLLKLNENLRIDNIDYSVKLSSIKDVLESFSNLNYQINKKLEFDIYDKIKPE
jgi:4-hydroxy-3-methylbut-2-en-1-yl diphosphate synthase IspG/GcpE